MFKKIKETWHYPRTELAKRILLSLDSGLSSALVFFAPRRMGKTQFLLYDMLPMAEKKGWQVSYFSFMDLPSGQSPEHAFMNFVTQLAHAHHSKKIKNKTSKMPGRVRGVSGSFAGISAGVQLEAAPKDPSAGSQENTGTRSTLRALCETLSQQGKTLFLLDEIQVLAKDANNDAFIGSLRTALDIHKEQIKVIFTGSSQTGLRKMFSEANAPFFHYGQNLPFPDLDAGFTDHLAEVFQKITSRSLNKKSLWDIFIELKKTPQLIRSVIEKLTLEPKLSLLEAKQLMLENLSNDRGFWQTWEQCSALEKLYLKLIADSQDQNTSPLFSQEILSQFAQSLGIEELKIPSAQSAIRSLLNKSLIGKEPDSRGKYALEDPHFQEWISQYTF